MRQLGRDVVLTELSIKARTNFVVCFCQS